MMILAGGDDGDTGGDDDDGDTGGGGDHYNSGDNYTGGDGGDCDSQPHSQGISLGLVGGGNRNALGMRLSDGNVDDVGGYDDNGENGCDGDCFGCDDTGGDTGSGDNDMRVVVNDDNGGDDDNGGVMNH